MTPQHDTPPRPLCQVCKERTAQAIIGGKDADGRTIRIPTCGECFAEPAPLSEVYLWRRSLRLVEDGWP